MSTHEYSDARTHSRTRFTYLNKLLHAVVSRKMVLAAYSPKWPIPVPPLLPPLLDYMHNMLNYELLMNNNCQSSRARLLIECE